MTSVPARPLRWVPHIAVATLASMMLATVLATVGDPMVAAMLGLLLAIAPVSLLWSDRGNPRHQS